MMWTLLLSVCVVVAAFHGSNAASYSSLGCWADTGSRAIATLEGTDPRLDGGYGGRANAIEKCFQVALSRGFPVFAIQDGGWCAGSADGLNTYDMYGPATNCGADGEGGGWANEVYKITDCDIDVVFVVDASSSIRGSGFTVAKDYVKAFTQCFTDEDVRMGVNTFDCTPRTRIALGSYELGDIGLITAIDSIGFTGGLSGTGMAVKQAKHILMSQGGVNKVVVVMSDGNSQDDVTGHVDDYADQCTTARAAGIEFYSVATGNSGLVNSGVLETIAGDFDRVFGTSNACDLASQIVADLCG